MASTFVNRRSGRYNMKQSSNNIFKKPLPSRATRNISPRSRASLRGALVAKLPCENRSRKIQFESNLEKNVLYLLLARNDVHDIWDQPTAVQYQSESGKTRRHVFDYLVTFKDGSRAAIAVKPAERVVQRNFRRELELIKASLPSSFANKVVLITERSFTKHDVHNAKKLHEFRKVEDSDADAAVANCLSRLTTETTLGELVSSTNLYGRAYRAVFRAIYSGKAKALDKGNIQHSTRIVGGAV